MAHDAFVREIRERPDDDALRLIFADWYEENHQAERAEYIRAACRLARLPLSDPGYPALQRRCLALYAAHYPDWVGDWPPDMEWSFERGLLTGVTCGHERIAARWKDLFARHPIHRVRLSNVADPVALSNDWMPLVDDLRVWWPNPTLRLFAHLDPAKLRFRRLWLDGDPDRQQVLRLVRGRTHAVIEAFRFNGHDHDGSFRDQRKHFHHWVAALSGSPLRELGLMFRRHAITPKDVDSILRADIAPQLEWLDLSSAVETIWPGEPLATTDRLRSLRRLDHGNFHGFEGILRNPHLARLATVGTEWSAETDEILGNSPFLRRVIHLHLWGTGWAGEHLPPSGVPLAEQAVALQSLYVKVEKDLAEAAHRWISTPWAGGLRVLMLEGDASGYGSGILPFVHRLARTTGFPALRALGLIIRSGHHFQRGDPVMTVQEVATLVGALRYCRWLRNVLVTCYLGDSPPEGIDQIPGIVPAATPEHPDGLARYSTWPTVHPWRAFHILPAE